ncbi:MAG: chemotaxis protein CheW [Planctomycetaceae bacterium]
MLWLIFHIGAERFAIRSERVDKVLPAVELHRTVQAPAGLAGAFSYHGAVTPVIDLAQWLLGTPTPLRLSSRMILIPLGAESSGPKFGLLAERVVELRPIDQDIVNESGAMTWSGALALGPVIADENGLLQLLDIERLITEARRLSLLPAAVEHRGEAAISNPKR